MRSAKELRSDIDGTVYDDYEIDEVGEKIKSHGNMYMSWNKDSLIKSLKNIYLLDDNFEV